ncbi:MAG TPA: ATP-binding protein [Pyrinomonadaceae bacterium]|nr:ATP-binding protein [Pyrinomonadaceae bacterium]
MATSNWHEANQRYLMARLAFVRDALKRHAARAATEPRAGDEDRRQPTGDESNLESDGATREDTSHVEAPQEAVPRENAGEEVATSEAMETVAAAEAAAESEGMTAPERTEDETVRRLREATEALPAPAALDSLCEAFALSPFERDVLLMCAGMELDADFAQLCAAAQGDGRRIYPTFGLALAALPEAHWNAITPAAALRRWRLVEIRQNGDTLTRSGLRIDERVLHYLTGISYLDERLRGLVEPVSLEHDPPPSHLALVEDITQFWKQSVDGAVWPSVFLSGDEDAVGKRLVAAHSCATLGLRLHVLRGADIPLPVVEREALSGLWQREAVLEGSVLLVEDDESEKTPPHAFLSFIESMHGMLFVAGSEMPRLRQRATLRLNVNKPDSTEQRLLWQDALGDVSAGLNDQLDVIISQFSLSGDRIRAASAQARVELARAEAAERAVLMDDATGQSREMRTPAAILWDACRNQARTRLDNLAQRIEPVAGWSDLILPEHQMRSLREIAAHIRQRTRVYETWGFAAAGPRGLGISALFAGASGTGKTMAAEVIARELRLDLYKIDLSQVVSKYIGETEKNLRRVFDAAEEGGAVLLFDEADALFGKRSDVKDSHDRYANIEVSYLLQRMESYKGLAILTTNMKTALDTAFMRRLRFVVQFPFPDAAQRGEIWRRVFPPQTPTENLEIQKLARLNVAGGNIRNIALNAAFHAADTGEAVTMSHILRAARSEYDKLEKTLTETETGGWR